MDTVFLWFELLSLIVAIVSYPYLKGSNLVMFIPFLVLTNIQEWGSHFGLFTFNERNSLSVNIFTTVEFIFYSWFFFREIVNPVFKKLIAICTPVLVLAIILNLSLLISPHQFHTYTYLPGAILMVFYACIYLFDLFRQEEPVQLTRYPNFWIALGLIFFYTGMFTYYSFFNIVSEETAARFIALFLVLINVFNIFLYGCFSIAFISARKWKFTTT